ncbi:MAG TPA: hypothetical protein VI790_03940 [Candidatus Nanoarchaeia archaeon]|nr:hypothetical protein [Candidatus Nanoarchaeia archaeon]
MIFKDDYNNLIGSLVYSLLNTAFCFCAILSDELVLKIIAYPFLIFCFGWIMFSVAKLIKPTVYELLNEGIKITDLSGTYLVSIDNIKCIKVFIKKGTYFPRHRLGDNLWRKALGKKSFWNFTNFFITVKKEMPEYYKGLNKITRFTRHLSPGISSKDLVVNNGNLSEKLTVDIFKKIYPKIPITYI